MCVGGEGSNQKQNGINNVRKCKYLTMFVKRNKNDKGSHAWEQFRDKR